MKAKHNFDPDPKIVKALLKLNKQKEFLVLEKEIDKELKEFPESSFLHNLKGSCLSNLNKFDESLISFNSALGFAKNPEVILNNIGVIQIKLNKFEDASKSFNKAIELKADYAEPHFNLGQTLGGNVTIEDRIKTEAQNITRAIFDDLAGAAGAEEITPATSVST